MEIMIPPLITIRVTATQMCSLYSMFSRATETPKRPKKKTRNINTIISKHTISESYQGTITLLNNIFLSKRIINYYNI